MVRGEVPKYVTERKEAEGMLGKSEALFRSLVQNLSDIITVADAEGTVTYVSPAVERILGYRPEELVGRSAFNYVHPNDLEEAMGIFAKVSSEPGIYPPFTFRVPHKDGSWRYLEYVVNNLLDDPSVRRVMVNQHDVTERKQAEEKIRKVREVERLAAEVGARLAAIVESSDDAIIGKTLEGVITSWNLGAQRLYGYSAEEVVGKPINILAPDDRQEEIPKILKSIRRGEPIDHFETVRMTKDGRRLDISLTVSPIKGGDGRIVGASTIARDITERKQAKEKIRKVREVERQRMARELHDGALQDLTYALAETQLVQGSFTNDVQDPENRLERVVEALKRSGRELRSAVYELSLERERDRPLAESIRSLVELNRRIMDPDREVRLEIEDGLPPAPLGEKTAELLRILQEALTNTRRHSEARHVRVAAGASKGKLWAEVCDDGRGFDPKEALAGMGTKGMRERAHALGGELKIIGKPGEGTRVRFELDLEREGEEPEEEVRILLVEDHASFRQGVAAVLERGSEFSIIGQAGSLAEAREVLDGVDVAIIDLGLPDGYGGELIKELRASNPQAQALVLSASIEHSEIARAVEWGAAGVLHKSSGMDEIAEGVRRLKAGETLLPIEEVVELVQHARSRRKEKHAARRAIARLTSREKEVLQTLAEGLDSKGIAKRLYISVDTERNHWASILVKLGVHSRLQALVFALRHGVVKIR